MYGHQAPLSICDVIFKCYFTTNHDIAVTTYTVNTRIERSDRVLPVILFIK